MERFDTDAGGLAGAERYFRHRCRQLLAESYFPCAALEELLDERTASTSRGQAWAAKASVNHEGETLVSVYVYPEHRKQGHMRRFIAGYDGRIVTIPDCTIEAALEQLGARYVVAAKHTLWPEYRAVEAHYADRRAQRSGARLMNHIDEGIALLRWLGAGEEAERAFCLHPLVQADKDLAQAPLSSCTEQPHVMALAIEYRHVANAYLSPMGEREPAAIRLSPLEAVNDMLRADKIQNYADFLRFHQTTHPRARELDHYFRAWLARLEIPIERFDELRAKLVVPGEANSQA